MNWREVKKRKWRKWNVKFIIVLLIFQHHNIHQNQSFHWFHQIGNWNEHRKTKRENVNERKENGWIYWKIIGMTSVCFYSGEQKENVSCYFMVFEMNYLNGSLNCVIFRNWIATSTCWKWNECLSALYHFAHLIVIAIAFIWKMSSAFEIESVKSLWNEWLETRMNEERIWKKNKKIDFENPPAPFGAELFLKKKTKTTRDNRQASSFLIPHLNAWAEARGGFGSAADVCCLVRPQIDWI